MTNGFNIEANGIDDLYNQVRQFHHKVNELCRHQVYVGALKSIGDKSIEFLQMICAVQNRGCIIKPVNGKYLTIPTPNADGKKASYFGQYSKGNKNGLFFHIASTSGKPTLARNVNGDLQVVFLLAKQVNIPARGFVDNTADECMYHVAEIVDSELQDYWDGRSDYIHTLNWVGRYLAQSMRFKMQSWTSPPNAEITKANKGENDPLIDTGDLQKSITWVIE